MPYAEAESRKGEGNEGHRIDRSQNNSRSNESTVLENQCKISIEKLASKKKIVNSACLPQAGNLPAIFGENTARFFSR